MRRSSQIDLLLFSRLQLSCPVVPVADPFSVGPHHLYDFPTGTVAQMVDQESFLLETGDVVFQLQP